MTNGQNRVLPATRDNRECASVTLQAPIVAMFK
jgi:hypothetical protein